MDVFAWFGRFVFFLLMLVLALENNITVPLRITSSLQWEEVPLMLIILGCFVAGVLAGTLALLPRLFRSVRSASRSENPRAAEAAAELTLTRAARQGGVAGDLEPDHGRRR